MVYMARVVSFAVLITIAAALPAPPPPTAQKSNYARWMASSTTWGFLSTISTRNKATSVGAPFGNPYSFADVKGVPYFYASDLDASMTDLFTSTSPMASSRGTLALSEATIRFTNGTAAFPDCRIGTALGDPENPPCARLVLSGVFSKVAPNSSEEMAATAALFARHPSFKHYPGDHNFYVAKMAIDGLWLINEYGGPAIIKPTDYFEGVSVPQPEYAHASPNATKCALKCAGEAVGVFGACAATCLTSEDKDKCIEERCEATQLAFELACTSQCAKAVEVGVQKAPLSSPPFWKQAETARWIAQELNWGVLSTVSTRSEGSKVGDAFGNPYGFADVNGVPYFYASDLDASMIDLKANTRASFTLSEAGLNAHGFLHNEACKIGTYLGDPENPPCARLQLGGTVSKLVANSTEEVAAKKALFARHPSFKNYPTDHAFFVAKLEVEGIWLIAIFGGAAIISPADYFKAKPDVALMV